MEKSFYDQPIDSDMKWYEEIKNRKRWRLHDWIVIRLWLYKNHYRLIAVDLSTRKELDANPKSIYWMEFIVQVKKLDANDAGNNV